MAESIGSLYSTQIPSLSETADIQEALRLYHYGAPSGTGIGEYDPTNSNSALLFNPSVAYYLNNLQSQITTVSGSLGVQSSVWTTKGDLVTRTSSPGVIRFGVGLDGTVLTANSTTTTGLEWATPAVTLTNSVNLSNKTLTTPTIDTINISASSIAAALWNTTLTTGSISVGGSLTSGTINIATGTSYTGTINIASGITTAGTKALNIGTSGGSGSTTNINIGSTGGTSTTTVLGAFKVGNTTLAQGVTGTVTLPSVAGTLALNPTTTIGDIVYASATGTPGTLARLAGNTLAQTAFLASTGNGTANTTTSFISSTGTAGSNVVLATSPTITTPTIDTINVSGSAIAAVLWNTTLTTGSISAGGALTSGGITLAGGTAFAGTIAIANASTSAHTISISNGAGTTNKTINIGTGSTGGTTAITLGSSSGATSTVTVNGRFLERKVTNSQTGTSYNVQASDDSRIIEMSNTSSNTVTVPNLSTIPVGSQIHILQTNTGQTTVAAGANVTINGTPGLKLRAQWSMATLIKRTTGATDFWVLVGDIVA